MTPDGCHAGIFTHAAVLVKIVDIGNNQATKDNKPVDASAKLGGSSGSLGLD